MTTAKKTFLQDGNEVAKCRTEVINQTVKLLKLLQIPKDKVDMESVDRLIDEISRSASRATLKKQAFRAKWTADGARKADLEKAATH